MKISLTSKYYKLYFFSIKWNEKETWFLSIESLKLLIRNNCILHDNAKFKNLIKIDFELNTQIILIIIFLLHTIFHIIGEFQKS